MTPGVLSLTDWPEGKAGVVSRVHTADRPALRKLIAMGVLPGSQLCLMRRSPSFVFQIGHARFSVDRELASLIFLQPDSKEGT